MRIEVKLESLNGTDSIIGYSDIREGASHTEIKAEADRLELQLLRNRNPGDYNVTRRILTSGMESS